MEENFSPKEIIKDIKQLDAELEILWSQNNLTKTRILLLGPTGCGKTTLMHLLSGCKMVAEIVKPNIKKVLCCKGGCKASKLKIGHRAVAETRIPSIIEEDEYLLCDCPGFLDNRSLSQRILNSYSIKKLLTPPCNVKILLFLNQYHFLQDRIISAVNLLDEAEHFFEDYYQFEECVGLVVTKVEQDITIKQLLESIEDIDLEKHRLLKFFISNPDRCFQINQPSSNQKYVFECKENIENFLKNGFVKDPKHETIIDKATIQQLCIQCNQMNDKMNEFLAQFSHNLAEKYKKEKEIEKLQRWIDIIKELRLASAQGIHKFYEIVCHYDEFSDIVEPLELFLVWSILYDQIVSNSHVASSNNYLFKCHTLYKKFDIQINELQLKRDNLEKNSQLLRDKNAAEITQQLEQYIKSGGVIITHSVKFFDGLHETPYHNFPTSLLNRLKPIEIEITNDDELVFDFKINNDQLKILLSEMEEILQYCFTKFKIIKDDDVIMSIFSKLRNTDIDPNDMKSFKKYKPTTGNKIAGIFENLAHPINVITGIPVALALLMRPILKNEKDIENVDKIDHWYFDGTLQRKIQIYEYCFRPMMQRYQTMSKLYQQNYSISCSFGGRTANLFPFEKIVPIVPNSSHLFLITQCQSMTKLIKEANNQNSMDVFNGVYSLYHKVCGEITNLKIDISGENLYQLAMRGDKIDNILAELSNDLSKPAYSLNDKIVLYSQILATTRMLGAINGRGIKSHERKKLFGLQTVVNSQDESGYIRVYSRQNIQDININIISHVQDVICNIENSSIEDIGDFTPASFVKTARDYIKKIKDEYNASKNEINDSIQSIFSSLSSFKNEISNDKTNNDGAKLLKDLEKVEGVEVVNQTKKDAKISFNGSIVKILLGGLTKFAPQIANAVKATIKCHQYKMKIDKLQKHEPLIRFYQRTTSSIKNPLVHGIIIFIDDNSIVSIDDIILNQ